DIADRLNWSAQNVSNYNNVFTRISTQVLEKAKHHQKGRVDNKSTVVDFTEGWFRNSGLYDLNEKYQERLIDDFIQDKFNWNSGKVKRG
ncbi:hypothetical protein, partial [Ruoffia sp. FAM 26255]|uniref:hypothetical protein n=1 Tax=Ruoffia sp. FAM 26255 TaxID=3259519 RepID=UPI00388B91EB